MTDSPAVVSSIYRSGKVYDLFPSMRNQGCSTTSSDCETNRAASPAVQTDQSTSDKPDARG